jgi:hypothetical protein
MNPAVSFAEQLNSDCDCRATNLESLRDEIDGRILDSHPHLFSDAPVFIESADLHDMQRLVDAVWAVTGSSLYQRTVLADAPALARHPQATSGVFTAFDFHISARGPRLIEINTNAGGALLNAAARRAQPPCCAGADTFLRPQPSAAELEERFVEMFRHEFRLARGSAAPLRTIAIVDDDPQRQYLHPEFLLFKRLFESHGIESIIVDAQALTCADGTLQGDGRRIDLVYNRLTDFYFDAPGHLALRQAYESDATVVTPHPRAHALLADKRNLARLTDAAFLQSIGADPAHVADLLRMIPRTRTVASDDEGWWTDRNAWFFKPTRGFGSRGTYRGDKMTRRVFAEVMKGHYVAQEFSPPSERWRATDSGRQAFKLDVRAFVYDRRIQLVAARLYQGQTTNFRTAGGGFAPVYEIARSGDARDFLAQCRRAGDRDRISP